MPSYYLDPVAGSDTNDGSEAAPWRTWAKVNPKLTAGVTVHAGAGTYADGPQFAGKGTAEQPIRIIGAGQDATILTRSINFSDRQYIYLSNLCIHATVQGWLNSNSQSQHIHLSQVRLTYEYTEGAALPYAGAMFKGSRHTFIEGSIEGWGHGDAVDLSASYCLFQDIDCSKCNSPHGVFAIKGDHNIVRGSDPAKRMVITNRWDRAFDVIQMTSMGNARENLFENLHIIQCNYDGEYPILPEWPQRHPGAVQMLKVGGDGNIYRHITIELCTMAPEAAYDYAAVMQAANYMGGQGSAYLAQNFKNGRFYEIDYIGNELNAIAYTLNNTIPYDYQNNHWFNCRFRGNLRALYIQSGIPQSQWPVIHNCSVEDVLSIAKEEFHIGEFAMAYPAQAWGNTDGTTAPERAPLCRVTVAGAGVTTITVDDARPIFDGAGLIEADRLTIGSNQPVTVLTKMSATQLELLDAVTVAVGDPVWLTLSAPPAPQPEPGAGVTFDVEVEGTVTVTRTDDDNDEAA